MKKELKLVGPAEFDIMHLGAQDFGAGTELYAWKEKDAIPTRLATCLNKHTGFNGLDALAIRLTQIREDNELPILIRYEPPKRAGNSYRALNLKETSYLHQREGRPALKLAA